MVSFFTPGAGDPTAVGDYAAELNALLARKQPPQTLTQPILASLPAIDTTMPTTQGGGMTEDQKDAQTINAISGALSGIVGAYGATQGAGAAQPSAGAAAGATTSTTGAATMQHPSQYGTAPVALQARGPSGINTTNAQVNSALQARGFGQNQPAATQPTPPPAPGIGSYADDPAFKRAAESAAKKTALNRAVSTATAPDGSSVLKNPVNVMSLLDPSFSWYAASGMGA